MSEQIQNDFMDGAELSAMLRGISPWTLAKWCNRKTNPLPCVKLGHRTRRYSRAAVLAWIATQDEKKS